MKFEYQKKDPSKFLSRERVLEIYKEVTGHEEQWVYDLPDYHTHSEEQLYEEFSNLNYICKRGQVEKATVLKKPIILTESKVREIFQEILSQDVKDTDFYDRMTEQELRDYLTKIKLAPSQYEKVKQAWGSVE